MYWFVFPKRLSMNGGRSDGKLSGYSKKLASASIISNAWRIVCESDNETVCVLDRRGCEWKSKKLCGHLSLVPSTSMFTDGIQIVVRMQRPCSVWIKQTCLVGKNRTDLSHLLFECAPNRTWLFYFGNSCSHSWSSHWPYQGSKLFPLSQINQVERERRWGSCVHIWKSCDMMLGNIWTAGALNTFE